VGSPHYLQGSPWVSNSCIYESPGALQVFLGLPKIYRSLRWSPILVFTDLQGSPHCLQGSPWVSSNGVYGSPGVSPMKTGVSVGLQLLCKWVSMGLLTFTGVSYLGLQGSPHFLQVSPWVVHVGLWGSAGTFSCSCQAAACVWVSEGLPIVHKGLHCSCSCSSSSSSSSINKEITEKTLNHKKQTRNSK